MELSVVIPCHNAGRYLDEAIASVLAQEISVPEFEVIVVNDRSSDAETLRALDSWPGRNRRVRVVDNAAHPGVSATRNRGIEEAAGEWIAFLDSDDVWLPGGLEARWRVARSEPEAEFIVADLRIWHADGRIEPRGLGEASEQARALFGSAYRSGAVQRLPRPVAAFLAPFCFVLPGAVLLRRSLLLRLRGFDVRLRKSEDLHLWLRAARVADAFVVPASVALYRRHPTSLSSQDAPPGEWSVLACRLLLEDFDFRPFWPALRRKLLYHCLEDTAYFRSRRQLRRALGSALTGIRHCPLERRAWRNVLAAPLP